MTSDATQVGDGSPRLVTQANELEVPPGYKRTEIGVIPESWDVRCLRSCIRASPKYGINAAAVPSNDGLPAYLRITDISEDSRFRPSPRVSVKHPDAPDYYLNVGDLVFARTGASVGKSYLYDPKDGPLVFAGFLIKVTPDAAQLEPKFLSYCVQTKRYWNWVSTTSVRSGQPGINGHEYGMLLVPIPHKEEQRAIAEALSDVDELIGALEALSAKKRAIKQAAMQQLLTGKTRLPGFSREWETKRLGRHVSFLRHGTHSRADLTADDAVRNLHYGDIHTSTQVFLDARETSMPRLAVHRAAGLDRLQDGDLVLVDASEDLNGVGKSVELTGTAGIDVVSGLHTIAARFDKTVLADGFKGYLQFCPAFRQQLTRLAAGTKVYATNRAHIASVEMSLPHPNEQRAIARVLSDMDAEIAALEARRDKTRAVKQGMMQQLLTGRIRLVKPAVASDKVTKHTGGRKANVHFVRSVLAAEIIDRLHEHPTFGHVKFEKMMFLVEHLCEIDMGSTYLRKAAGPYDGRALRSIDSQIRKQQWFDARKVGERYRYVPMPNRGGHKKYFDRYFPEIGKTFDTILEAFETFDTERCEIVATLLAAWKDLLRSEDAVSDSLIVHEVMNNWHESKRRIPAERWLNALDWMKGQGFVPKGTT